MSNQDSRDRFAVVPDTPFHPGAGAPESVGAAPRHDHRLERLTDRLPERWQAAVRRLRQPCARRVRIPAGVLLIIGGCLFILPILGLWMVPLGLILLAEDVPVLRRLRDRVLDWIERHRPHWFAGDHK